eukprot:3589294-Rhodomonas_salina.2
MPAMNTGIACSQRIAQYAGHASLRAAKRKQRTIREIRYPIRGPLVVLCLPPSRNERARTPSSSSTHVTSAHHIAGTGRRHKSGPDIVYSMRNAENSYVSTKHRI